MSIDNSINQFRVASRDMFNHYFRIDEPHDNDGWTLEWRFVGVEQVLFRKLVTEPALLPDVPYGHVQNGINVRLRGTEPVPIMLNREQKSGYWDHPTKEIPQGTELSFVSFFDWDQLEWRDNRYVRVVVESCPSQPELDGKQGLIESRHVEFGRALAK
jgi:hypothetical protein